MARLRSCGLLGLAGALLVHGACAVEGTECQPGEVRRAETTCGVCGTGTRSDVCGDDARWHDQNGGRCEDLDDRDGDGYANRACGAGVPVECADEDPAIHPAPAPGQCVPDTREECVPPCGSGDHRVCLPTCEWGPCALVDEVNLRSVWGSSRADVYAVGDHGLITHYDGRAWTRVEPPVWRSQLRDVWGSGPDDVFVVGDVPGPSCDDTLPDFGTILHFDGESWSWIDSGAYGWPILAVWGSGPTDVFASIGSGGILRFDGSAWSGSTVPFGPRTPNGWVADIWGTAPDDAFAVGTDGASGMVLHWNGAGYDAATAPTADLRAVWGDRRDDYFAVSWAGEIYHFDGTTWSPMASGTTKALFGISGVDGEHVYAAGQNGLLLCYDGSSWSRCGAATARDLRAVWAAGPDEVFAVGDGGIVHLCGPML